MQRKTCLFCRCEEETNQKKRPIYENNGAYSILNYKPSVPGHVLVVPKHHVINLEELKGSDLEDFIHAIPLTFVAIQQIYETHVQKLVDYYESLLINPPEKASMIFARNMLDHPHLRERPVAYNWGMNCGFDAGQREIHLHVHLFPRRGKGLGIATAMRKHLAIKETNNDEDTF